MRKTPKGRGSTDPLWVWGLQGSLIFRRCVTEYYPVSRTLAFRLGTKTASSKLANKSRCAQLLYANHIEHDGVRFFEEICNRDLEGIVAKRKNSPYKDSGKTWIKVKNPKYSQAEGRQGLLKRR
jgi:hypothetical protein